MAIFAGGVTDDFNRNPSGGAYASAGPNWSGPWTTYTPPPGGTISAGPLPIAPSPNNYLGIGGAGSPSSTTFSDYWNAATFLGTDVSAKLMAWYGAFSYLWLFARIQNPGLTTSTCYALQLAVSSNFITLTIAQYTGWVGRQLASAATAFAPTVGDLIGFRVYDHPAGGVMLEGWTKLVSEANWNRRVAVRDTDPARITSAGYTGTGGWVNVTGQGTGFDDYSVAEGTYGGMADIPGFSGGRYDRLATLANVPTIRTPRDPMATLANVRPIPLVPFHARRDRLATAGSTRPGGWSTAHARRDKLADRVWSTKDLEALEQAGIAGGGITVF